MMLILCLLACSEPEDTDSKRPPLNDSASPEDSETGGEDSETGGEDSETGGEDSDPPDPPEIEPPLGATSGGAGGATNLACSSASAGGASYLLIVPATIRSAAPLLIVISGTEGSSLMCSNMRQVAGYYGLGDAVIAVLDGRQSDANDGAAVLDAVRADYDIDNDQTWLLSESAGTMAGLELAFHARPSFFAAYWANDVNAQDTPGQTAAELGFAPWGNAGPGGDLPDAEAIVDGMRAAGWLLPSDAPYSGPGSTTHGSTDQFLAAVDFFAGKVREALP